jgi:hypothetical protein
MGQRFSPAKLKLVVEKFSRNAKNQKVVTGLPDVMHICRPKITVWVYFGGAWK